MIALTARFLREHYRFAWKLLLLEVVVAWLFPYMLVTMLHIKSGGSADPPSLMESRNLLMNFLALGVLAFGTCGIAINIQAAKARRILPVSNAQMTASQFLVAIVNLAVMFVVTTIGYRVIFDVNWPIVSTTCWVCGWFSLIVGVGFWLSDSRWFRIPLVAILIGAAGYWMADRIEPVGEDWSALRWDDGAFLIITTCIGYGMLLQTYARFRFGELVKGRLLTSLLNADSLFEDRMHGHSQHRFSSGLQSLHWLESKRALPSKAFVTALISSALIAVLTMMIYSGDASDACFLAMIQATFIAGAASGIMGHDTIDIKKRTMKHHFCVIPVSSGQLAGCFRKSIFHNVVVSIVVVIASYVIAFGLAALMSDADAIPTFEFRQTLLSESGKAAIWIPIAFAFLTAWIAAGIGATVSLYIQVNPGRSMLALYAMIAIGLLPFLCSITQASHIFELVSQGLVLAVLTLISWKVLSQLVVCQHRHMISVRTAWAVAVVVIVLALVVFLAVPTSLFGRTIAGLVAIWAAVPYSSLPLAVASFRHR